MPRAAAAVAAAPQASAPEAVLLPVLRDAKDRRRWTRGAACSRPGRARRGERRPAASSGAAAMSRTESRSSRDVVVAPRRAGASSAPPADSRGPTAIRSRGHASGGSTRAPPDSPLALAGRARRCGERPSAAAPFRGASASPDVGHRSAPGLSAGWGASGPCELRVGRRAGGDGHVLGRITRRAERGICRAAGSVGVVYLRPVRIREGIHNASRHRRPAAGLRGAGGRAIGELEGLAEGDAPERLGKRWRAFRPWPRTSRSVYDIWPAG